MTSLHITHTVRDLAEWTEIFSSFEEVRTRGGVTATHVRHDGDFVVVDLEFAAADEAASFLDFLETQVWPSSPHLEGVAPTSRILEPLALANA